jgi:hypothetical protein
MKTVTMPKKESTTLTIAILRPRLRGPRQRSATFKSGKEYNRKREKQVNY